MIPAHGASLRQWAVPARVAAADRRLGDRGRHG